MENKEHRHKHGSRFIDLTGMRFGRLLVLNEDCSVERLKSKPVKWKCLCDCGQECIVSGTDLRALKTQSCGCLRAETTTKRSTTHGHAKERLYSIWRAMLARCENPKHKNYKYYGMRGMRVCEEWHQYENFRNWAVARDDYSPKTTLDRIDSHGNYEPSNCRFETSVNQVINRRSTIWVDYNGERVPLRELVEKSGIPRDILRHRLQDGWDVEKAISTPVTKYNTKNKENTDFKE